MKAEELLGIFNTKFGLDGWPKSYEVDAETYGNVCQFIFEYSANKSNSSDEGVIWTEVALGPNDGIMFKNVELKIKQPVYEDVQCPECGGKMISRKGQYGTFWGCTKYPNCRGTRDSMGRSKVERDEEKSKPRESGRWNVT
jgi:ribosomal protein L37AE/L43A